MFPAPVAAASKSFGRAASSGLRLGSLSSRSRFAGPPYPAYPVYAPQHLPRGHAALTAAGGREGAQEFVPWFLGIPSD